MNFNTWEIPASGVRSLCWREDELVDWVAGEHCYRLDGNIIPAKVRYSYRFDTAVASPSGNYVVIYEKLGTKGLILHHGKPIRQIDRDFYHAHVYEFPVALFRLPDGREVIAHCPNDYRTLHIDDLATGERLTDHPGREPQDIFYSRLAANNSGTHLFTAGWIWHPFDDFTLYDVGAVLDEPALLGGRGIAPKINAEVSSAVFLDDETLALASSDEEALDDELQPDDTLWMNPSRLAVYSVAQQRYTSQVSPQEKVGMMMPMGQHHVIGFFEHPKVFDLRTGSVVHTWPELATGKQESSIIHHIDPVPPLALDPAKWRFAVASSETITVIQIDLSDSGEQGTHDAP